MGHEKYLNGVKKYHSEQRFRNVETVFQSTYLHSID